LLVSSSMIEHCWNTLSNRYLNCNENCILFFLPCQIGMPTAIPSA
jgi:hypothetical protein